MKLNQLDPKLAQRIRKQVADEDAEHDRQYRWTPDEEKWLIEHYPSVGREKSAEVLGKPVGAIRAKASRLGLTLNRGMPHYNEVQKQQSVKKTKWWKDNGDKFLTPELRQRMSDWLSKSASKRNAEQGFSRCKRGFRPDLGITVRSAWEANYARYLNFLITSGDILEWEYESETFWFDKIKRGCRSYKPDFRVLTKDGKIEYHEVKGWMYPRARTALNRMRIYHESVKIVLIDAAKYRSIAKSMKHLIKEWE